MSRDRLRRLRQLQWGVRAALALGVAASVAANVMHARPDLAARVISAWAPVALLVVIELISRVPVHRKSLAVARHGAAVLVAGVAAWASYWHMAAVAARHGEEVVTAHLLPVSVDMLIVVASVCLLEIGGRIRAELDGAEGAPTAAIPAPAADVPTAVTAPARDGGDGVATSAGKVATEVASAPEPRPAGKVASRRRRTPRPRRGTGRHEVARAYAQIPAADDRSQRAVAADIAARTGLTVPTVRRYLAEIHAAAPTEAEMSS